MHGISFSHTRAPNEPCRELPESSCRSPHPHTTPLVISSLPRNPPPPPGPPPPHRPQPSTTATPNHSAAPLPRRSLGRVSMMKPSFVRHGSGGHAEFGPDGLRREWTLYDEAAVWMQIHGGVALPDAAAPMPEVMTAQ